MRGKREKWGWRKDNEEKGERYKVRGRREKIEQDCSV
jgi:hypothetical protein